MHLKHRPTNFDEVVGNEVIKKSLQGITKSRPILFEGSLGSGKTTLAYIVAKEFGAPPENIKEINCVHVAGIAEAREIVDTLGFSSLFGSKRVLLLEELHWLPPKAIAEFLKPLEVERDNVLVIATTNETSKINSALLSRFTVFKVAILDKKQSKFLIDKICKLEDIQINKYIKQLLVDTSEGIPRRILTGLSKVRNVTDPEDAKYLLNTSNLSEETDEDVLELFKLIISGSNWDTIKKVLNSTLKNKTPESVRVELMNLIGFRVVSEYYKHHSVGSQYQLLLDNLFESLKNANSFPGKAQLIMAIYKNFIDR